MHSDAWCILLLALAQSVDAFVATRPSPSKAEFFAMADKHEDEILPPTSFERTVPVDLDIFRSKFRELLGDDKRAGKVAPYWKEVKVALGIFTTLTRRAGEIRQILRDTWMQHPNVCSYHNMTAQCHIRILFVAGIKGQNWVDQYKYETTDGMQFLTSEPDVTLLDVKENMNEGKTFYWLQFASRRFYGVDYIGKLDDDAFLHVANALERIPLVPQLDGCEAYLGKPWTCLGIACPPRACGPPIGGNFMNYSDKVHDCWSYMQGGFYVMSRKLAAALTVPGMYYDKHKMGDEDLFTGRAVHHHARATGKCIRTWDSRDIAFDNLFYHARAENEHPGGVSAAWDEFYNY